MSDDTWTVAVQVPAALPGHMKDTLFAAVADAAHDWEPKVRDGWDVHVTGYTPRGAGWAEAVVEQMRELIDSYPPGSDFAESGAQALFRHILLAEHDPPAEEEKDRQVAFDASPPLSGLVGLDPDITGGKSVADHMDDLHGHRSEEDP